MRKGIIFGICFDNFMIVPIVIGSAPDHDIALRRQARLHFFNFSNTNIFGKTINAATRVGERVSLYGDKIRFYQHIRWKMINVSEYADYFPQIGMSHEICVWLCFALFSFDFRTRFFIDPYEPYTHIPHWCWGGEVSSTHWSLRDFNENLDKQFSI